MHEEAEARAANEVRTEKAAVRFPEVKARVLEDLARADASGDEGALASIASEYRKVADPEFRVELATVKAHLEKIGEERHLAEQAEEKAKADAKAADIPGNVVALSKEILGDRYKGSTAESIGGGWAIMIRAKAKEYINSPSPSSLQHEMLKLAYRCHPKGMKVGRFTVIYDAELTDGLGNNSEGEFLRCEMIKGISDKINWGDGEADLYALNFSRVFSTEFCNFSYEKEWEKSLRK